MLPVRNEVLYVPRGRAEKPQRFEVKRAKPMYIPKGSYVVRGTIQPSRLNEPVVIGHVPQRPMTNPSTVPWNYQRTLVTYKGREVTGELSENTFIGRYSNTQELNNATRKRFPPKEPVSVEEAEAFFQKMKMPDYEVVDQLRKCPEQVSMLSLLMRSAEHQKILLKTLNEAYVPVETSVEQLERMTERFFAVNQVLDMDTSYNFLLGRPWIHTAGAVPSTLHQMVKFEYEDREIVVRGEDKQSIYRDPSISYLKPSEGSEHTVYQAFEVVLAEQYEEGRPCPQPFLSNASIMGEKNMLAQENEVLRAQVQQMRIAANNQQRSRSDERLIKGLKREIGECRDELKKSEGTIAELRAQWVKRTEERTHYMQQLKKDYEKTIGSLKRKVVTLEDKAVKQAKTFETESEHCYDLLARMEVEIQQLQDQHLQDSHVLEARNNQVR
ncbi:uncharacterized protein [Nicotiana sylvestris]|uniref:uncharacterized protein n=1 Tax=Nicotiana sylvestris TaxID=4096 RepID=UPI00388C97C6